MIKKRKPHVLPLQTKAFCVLTAKDKLTKYVHNIKAIKHV